MNGPNDLYFEQINKLLFIIEKLVLRLSLGLISSYTIPDLVTVIFEHSKNFKALHDVILNLAG